MPLRTAVWILGSQLQEDHPALRQAMAQDGREAVTVILVESKAKLNSRPYHRKKLVLLLSAMRHYAVDLRLRGYEVDLVKAESFTQGMHADGGVVATKPYIASANYINKMSDYCPTCVYDRRRRTGPDACPFNTLYWNFLIENEKTLRSNPRMGPNVLGLRHLDPQERRQVQKDAQDILAQRPSNPA